MSDSSSSSSLWLATYTKLRFFTRIRRFIKSKTFKSRFDQSISKQPDSSTSTSTSTSLEVMDRIEEAEDHHVTNEGESVVLQRSVKRLHFGNWKEKIGAAMEIRKLAEEDVQLKQVMAELGVIPSLVSMAESKVADSRSVAIQALIELSNGSYRNKVLMVEAEILKKLPENIGTSNETTMHEYAQLLLSISSLSNTHFPLTAPKFLPFLLSILKSTSSSDTKELCLSTIYNFSTVLENTSHLVENGLVQTLLSLCSIKETSEKSLATLANLVVTLMGKKAMEANTQTVPGNLIEILTWGDKPKCQELSCYILMILAHQSSVQRLKMSKLGIVPILLEVALVGNSQLAQKRAMKLLQWFKDERQVRMGPHSGPQITRIIIGSPMNKKDVQVGKKLMKRMVKDSLNKNMEIITRRANTGTEEGSNLKALVISTSSKSLPY